MKSFKVVFVAVERTLFETEVSAETAEEALLKFNDNSEDYDWRDSEIIESEPDRDTVRVVAEWPKENTSINYLPWPKWLKDKYMVCISDPVEIANARQNSNVSLTEVGGKYYLAFVDGEIIQYTRGNAIKKARVFGGKIVKN